MIVWWLFAFFRALFGSFFLFSSIYLLLAYVPLTHERIHLDRLLPWVNRFGETYVVWYYLAALAATCSMCVDRPQGCRPPRLARRLRASFLVFLLAAGATLPIAFRMGAPVNSPLSLAGALVWLVPLLWVAVMDWAEIAGRIRWAAVNRNEDGNLFRAVWQSALFTAFLSAGLVYARASRVEWTLAPGLFAVGLSALSHMLILYALFVALILAGAIASWFSRPPRALFLFSHLVGAGLAWLAIRSIIFPGMSFSGLWADVYALAFSITIGAYLAGLCLRIQQRRGGAVESGFALAFFAGRQETPASRRRLAPALISLAAVAGAGGLLTLNAAKMDWDYLLQKLSILVVWLAAFRVLYGFAAASSRKARTAVMLLAALATLAGHRTLQANQRQLWKRIDGKTTSMEFLNRYAGYDVSFRLVRQATAPPTAAAPDFHRYLAQHTNIPRAVKLSPVDINLVPRLDPRPGAKPNIFLFVIDSLRSDYVSAYNNRVDFTPSLEAFARESIVFRNTYTHYGATGLSVPSIWVGGMMIHQQYVKPFPPMNGLEKLLLAEKYKMFVSRDTIVGQLLLPSAEGCELDRARENYNYDFCGSLQELQAKIEGMPPARDPIFAYTQPQNIHISVINRQGAKAISGEDYRPFWAPYASRVRRMDGCFGQFIQFLKDRGLYENSIVIFTADHGDSLGEQGRWGHAYTIYPEVIRIPLIVHLPAAMRDAYRWNPGLIAFSTDITPSLYYLLGHRPTMRHELFGRPLFTERMEEQGPYLQDHYLIASSYGAVYGILTGDARTLFVSDGINRAEYLFDLPSYSGSGAPASTSMTAENQQLLRKKIDALAAFYGYKPR